MQQQYHPDKAEDKDQALIKSSEINQAFKTLSQVDSRAAYLLALKKQDHHLDQSISDFEFLQSALELREQLDEATSSEHLRTLRLEVQQWIDGLVREFKIDYSEEDWAETYILDSSFSDLLKYNSNLIRFSLSNKYPSVHTDINTLLAI